MSYSQWLDTISNIIPNILNWISTMIDSLFSNYIIITILGFVLFYTFLFVIMDFISSLKRNKKDDFDNVK